MKMTTGNDIKSSEIMSGEWLYGCGGVYRLKENLTYDKILGGIKMKMRLVTVFLITVMIMSVFAVPTLANEIEVMEISEEGILDIDTFYSPLRKTTEELNDIFSAVLEGSFIGDENIHVEFLGAIDGWDNVVEITERLYTITARNGDMFSENITTRIAERQNSSTETVAPSIRITAAIGFAIRTADDFEREIQLRWYSADAVTTMGQFRINRMIGEFGQQGMYGSRMGTFNVLGSRVVRTNTNFTQWSTTGWGCITGMDVLVEYVDTNTSRVARTRLVTVRANNVF